MYFRKRKGYLAGKYSVFSKKSNLRDVKIFKKFKYLPKPDALTITKGFIIRLSGGN